MGDLRNKIRKLQQAEGERLARMRLSASRNPAPTSPICGGCGLDSHNQWKPDGTFVRLFSVSGDHWDTAKLYCECCLERLTGEKPDGP